MQPLTEVWPLSTTSHCSVVGFHMRRVLSLDPLTMRPSPSTATDVTPCATHHAAADQPLPKHGETNGSTWQALLSASHSYRNHSISSQYRLKNHSIPIHTFVDTHINTHPPIYILDTEAKSPSLLPTL